MIVENGARIPRNDSYLLSLKSRLWVASHAVSSWLGERLLQGFDPDRRDRFDDIDDALDSHSPFTLLDACSKYRPHCHGAYEGPLIDLGASGVAASAPTKPWRMGDPNHGGSLSPIRVRTV